MVIGIADHQRDAAGGFRVAGGHRQQSETTQGGDQSRNLADARACHLRLPAVQSTWIYSQCQWRFRFCATRGRALSGDRSCAFASDGFDSDVLASDVLACDVLASDVLPRALTVTSIGSE